MKHEELYKITVNRDQLTLIADCIEDISRFSAGQPELYHTIGTLLARHDDSCEKRDAIEYHLREVKKMIYPELRGNASYGYNGGDQKDPLRKGLIGTLIRYTEAYFISLQCMKIGTMCIVVYP